jgi:transposase-like protein
MRQETLQSLQLRGRGGRQMSGVLKLGSGEVDLSHPLRRKYSAEFKLRILAEASGCSEPGAVMAMLRREGIYSSHLRRWRKEQAEGGMEALAGRKPGSAAKPPDSLEARAKELEKENRALKRKLKRAEWLLEIAKKGAELMEKMALGHQFESDDSE